MDEKNLKLASNKILVLLNFENQRIFFYKIREFFVCFSFTIRIKKKERQRRYSLQSFLVLTVFNDIF